MRVYAVVDSRLSRGAQAAQAIHAVQALTQDYPGWGREWYGGENVIIVLECDDLHGRLDTFPGDIERGESFGVSEFREPDFDNGLTAFAVFSDAGDTEEARGQVGVWLSDLPLVGSKRRWPWEERKFQRWENNMRGSAPVVTP